jgi:hypothetical protein
MNSSYNYRVEGSTFMNTKKYTWLCCLLILEIALDLSMAPVSLYFSSSPLYLKATDRCTIMVGAHLAEEQITSKASKSMKYMQKPVL